MYHHILYDDGHHKCVVFSMPHDNESVPSNQFLIIDGDEAAVIDPGGDLTFAPLTINIIKHTRMTNIRYVIGSHQDPDIIASMPRWLIHVEGASVLIPKLWERFLPHYNSAFTKGRLKQSLSERLMTIPDIGGYYPLGNNGIVAMPAHFLHSVGNFQFYDPVSKILFSGDMGASLVGDSGQAVQDFHTHIGNMEGFHQRYMTSKKVTRLWADAVRNLDVSMMVPQHGYRLEGQEVFHQFLDWISQLDCGIDLFNEQSYQFKQYIPDIATAAE
ncbi:oxygen-binding di-iron domain-containing protein [Psychrobacter jeotgali]|uniref:MBL fold metallo-hydrolase n=1 Tax=Psychrobacter jeotgali TaxID=179010 RepID=UPI0019188E65|nr:MBL fold metallo-hydrolase [Psychrobacter jeotgali]